MFTSGRPGGKSFQAKVPDNIWWGSPTNLAALSSNRTISCTTNLPTNLPTNSHTSHYLDIISHEVCIHNTVIPYGKTIMQTSSHEILVQDRLDSFIHWFVQPTTKTYIHSFIWPVILTRTKKCLSDTHLTIILTLKSLFLSHLKFTIKIKTITN